VGQKAEIKIFEISFGYGALDETSVTGRCGGANIKETEYETE
jgi:hypothetical protein